MWNHNFLSPSDRNPEGVPGQLPGNVTNCCEDLISESEQTCWAPKVLQVFSSDMTWRLDGLSRVQLLCYVASPQFLLSGKSSKVKVSRVVSGCYDVLMELLRSKQVHHILDGTLIGLPKLEKHLQWMFEEVKKLVGYEICECLNVRNL